MLSPACLPEIHPLADAVAFPEMATGAYLPFAEDVRRHGLRVPILLYEGMILDGRARARAAREHGRTWSAEIYDGPDPLGALVSRNLARRHLDESQRAMVAARLATLRRGRPARGPGIPAKAGISQAAAAQLLHVSADSIDRAARVRRDGIPALAAAVERGEIAVSAAADIARAPAARQAEILAFPEREVLAAAKQIRLRRQAEKRGQRVARLAEIASRPAPWPNGRRWPVLLADPPWEQEVWSDETGQDRGAVNHYPTMPLDEIRALAVDEIATPDACLALWSPRPRLFDALLLMQHWGFRYVSNAAWVKDRTGNGYWFRDRHEHLLVGTRGAFPAPLMGTQMASVVEAPWRGHSVKPDAPAEMFDRLYPGVPKIELFARGDSVRPGWDWWGYEAGPAPAREAVA